MKYWGREGGKSGCLIIVHKTLSSKIYVIASTFEPSHISISTCGCIIIFTMGRFQDSIIELDYL